MHKQSHISYELESTALKLGELAEYLNGVVMQTCGSSQQANTYWV